MTWGYVMDDDALLRRWATYQRSTAGAESTISNRAAHVRRLSEHAGRPAAECGEDEVREWLAALPVRASTKATYWAGLRAWFRWLHAVGVREDNPLLGAPAPRSPRRMPHPVEDEHLDQLLTNHRFYRRTEAMILLAALAGLRVHEIAQLRGEDVDPVGRTIRVEGKGGVDAVLPLHPRLLEVAERMPQRGWWFPARARGNRSGTGHLLPRSVTDVVRLAMRRAGVPGSAHWLRHWFGTTLVDSGANLRATQTMLRHASLATTQIYTAVSSRQLRAAVDGLDPHRARRVDDEGDQAA